MGKCVKNTQIIKIKLRKEGMYGTDYYILERMHTCNVCPCTFPKVRTVTDSLMEVQKFISALTECTGDTDYSCITR